jgi:hypothetical protein
MSTTSNRLNDLAVESTQTMFETANFLQKQNAALIQSWFSTMEANEKNGRELLRKAMKQTQEAQTLWLDYVRESFRDTTETFTRVAGSQLRGFTERMENVTAEVKNGKKVEPAAK